MKKILNVTSEFTIGKLRAHKCLCRTVAGASSFLMLMTVSAPAFAEGTAVLGDNATLTGATGANLAQNTDAYAQFVSSGGSSAVLDWTKFNIGAGKEMNFSGAGTTFFNLVNGASKSQVDGIISGNGSVWVINPNGVAFGANSQVNVGGLFAAAAGNISNADQLRDGTANAPAFSSFTGNVEANCGDFSAEQVALLGKHVAVGEKADFSDTLALSVGGGKSLMVDAVAGGKVTIDVDSAADFAGEAISIDGLVAGNAFVEMVAAGDVNVKGKVNAGDLSVGAMGSVALNGDVATAIGDISVSSAKQGNLTQNGLVDSAGAVTLMAANGDVMVDGAVKAEYGVSISAGKGYSSSSGIVDNRGSVTIGEKASVVNETDGDIIVSTVDGSISVDNGGSIKNSAAGYTALMASGGDIKVDGSMNSAGDTILSGNAITADNADNHISGTLTAMGDSVSVTVDNGLKVDKVFATAGDVSIATVSGDIIVDGTVASTATDGLVVLKAATDANSDGSIIVNGTLKADNVYGYAGYGKLYGANSNMSRNESPARTTAGLLAAPAGASVIRLNKAAEVIGAKLVRLESEADVKSAGLINAATAALEVYAQTGAIGLYEDGTGKVITGEITVVADGNINVGNSDNYIGSIARVGTGDNTEKIVINQGKYNGGEATVIGGVNQDTPFEQIFPGSVIISDDITAAGGVTILTQAGDLVIVDRCKVEATGNGAIVYLQAGYSAISDLSMGKDSSVVAEKGAAKLYATGSATLANVSVGGSFEEDMGLGVEPIGIDAMSMYGSLTLRDGAEVKSTSADASIYLTSSLGYGVQGNLNVYGNITAGNGSGSAAITASSNFGDVNVLGNLVTDSSVMVYAVAGNTTVSGKAQAREEVYVASLNGNVDIESDADLNANGSEGGAFINAKNGSVSVAGDVKGNQSVMLSAENGTVRLDGHAESAGEQGTVVLQTTGFGDVVIGRNGRVDATQYGIVKTDNGNLRSETAIAPSARKGFVDVQHPSAAIKAGEMLLDVKGSVGSADGYFPLIGKVYGMISGDAFIAAAEGTSIVGGNDPGLGAGGVWSQSNDIGTTFDVTGSLGLYTAGSLEMNGAFKAGGKLTMSAASFGNGDVSYLQPGGMLTLNNVGKPAHPQIAYFNTLDGKEPQINNQPNDTVIFVDGRLAGGNLKILNQFGANEAFLVATPELKSTQGIFGNPTFLHSDLDVANPMEVSAIDYMLQETPRLTLDKDFPAEVDSHVDSVVVPEKDSIQFGRTVKDEQSDKDAEPKSESVLPLGNEVVLVK